MKDRASNGVSNVNFSKLTECVGETTWWRKRLVTFLKHSTSVAVFVDGQPECMESWNLL